MGLGFLERALADMRKVAWDRGPVRLGTYAKADGTPVPLSQIARFHDDEVSRTIEWFTKAFEPLLMAVLGLAIGGVVVLMYMPIFELAGSIR